MIPRKQKIYPFKPSTPWQFNQPVIYCLSIDRIVCPQMNDKGKTRGKATATHSARSGGFLFLVHTVHPIPSLWAQRTRGARQAAVERFGEPFPTRIRYLARIGTGAQSTKYSCVTSDILKAESRYQCLVMGWNLHPITLPDDVYAPLMRAPITWYRGTNYG